MRKIILTFGLISGAILSFLMAASLPFHDAIGFDRALILGYTTMVLSFMLIFFGVKSYRDNVAGGSVSFGRAFKVGALIAVISSLCYVATWQVIYFGFDSDYMAKYQVHMVEEARADGATQAEIDKKVADWQKWTVLYQNPAINAAVTLLEPLPVGLLIALVSAGILRRRKGSAPEGSVAVAI